MRVKDLPEPDRPRERLFARGAEALADRELLALLLGNGTATTDAIELAGRLLARYGGMHALGRADPHELLALPGIGPAKVTRVAAAFQVARRATPGEATRKVTGSADLAAVVAPLLRGLRHERVVVVCCDSGGSLLRSVTLTEGGSDRSLVPVRDVLSTVLSVGAAAFGMAHNHPCQGLEPSEQDRRVTERLREAAGTVGLRFLDHVVVTDTAWRRITTAH